MKFRIALCVVLLVNCGCASVRRHPLIYGMVGGAVIGGTVAIVTHHSCPKVYDGRPYDGTPPCPK